MNFKTNMNLKNIIAGDMVRRNMLGVELPLIVSAVTKDKIICGPWEFCRETGDEIDAEMSYSPSFIVGTLNNKIKQKAKQ